MDLLVLLDRLDDAHAELRIGPGGNVALYAPDHIRLDITIRAAIRQHHSALLAHIKGARTGHALGFCTVCNAVSLTHYQPASKYPACRITPGCEGRHAIRDPDVVRLAAAAAPARPKQTKPPTTATSRRLLGPWPADPWARPSTTPSRP